MELADIQSVSRINKQAFSALYALALFPKDRQVRKNEREIFDLLMLSGLPELTKQDFGCLIKSCFRKRFNIQYFLYLKSCCHKQYNVSRLNFKIINSVDWDEFIGRLSNTEIDCGLPFFMSRIYRNYFFVNRDLIPLKLPLNIRLVFCQEFNILKLLLYIDI